MMSLSKLGRKLQATKILVKVCQTIYSVTMADQLTLFQPGGRLYPLHYYSPTPSDFHTFLQPYNEYYKLTVQQRCSAQVRCTHFHFQPHLIQDCNWAYPHPLHHYQEWTGQPCYFHMTYSHLKNNRINIKHAIYKSSLLD